MARPTTKSDLLTQAKTNYDKLSALIDTLSIEQQEAPITFVDGEFKKVGAHWERDKNLRDILIHLHEWHQLLLQWVAENIHGNSVPFLPAPYNWKSYGEMNVEFWKKHQTTSLEDAKAMLQESYAKVIHLIEGMSNEELFTRQYFDWTGNNALGSYCISATSSHYDWALKKVKLHKKSFQ